MPAKKQARTENQQLAADIRRTVIANLLTRQPTLSQRQIQQALSRGGYVNPLEDNKPWSLGTINRDLRIIRQRAIKEAGQKAERWLGWQWRHIQGALTLAYERNDPKAIVQVLKHHANLFGLTYETITLILRQSEARTDPRLENIESLDSAALTELYQELYARKN